MLSSHHHRFLLVALLPLSFGLGCGKRAGLDRGDASATNLEPSSEAMPTSPRGYESGSNGNGEFATAPEGDESAADSAPSPAAPAGPSPRYEPSTGSSAPSSRKPSAASESVDGYALNDTSRAAKAQNREAYRPREQRPGLGTSWGETRDSRVSVTSFERDNEYTPTATQRIFYNDARGVLAQTGFRSISALGNNRTEFGNGFVTVEIVDPDGSPLPGVYSGGRSYVVGTDGDRYAIRVRNNEGYRVEVVATVDGLDVIDGTKGTFQKRGYVVDPYASLLIEGFRRSKSAVASFRFGAVSDSYAARTGSDRNVGVIGVAVFAERGCCVQPYSNQEIDRRETADPFPGQFARPPAVQVPRPRRPYGLE